MGVDTNITIIIITLPNNYNTLCGKGHPLKRIKTHLSFLGKRHK